MQTRETSRAKLTAVAVFPPNSFLENPAVRADGSILVTEILQHQLWYVPPPAEGVPAEPVPVHTFDQFTMGIVEAGPDVFYVNTSDRSPRTGRSCTGSICGTGIPASLPAPRRSWSSPAGPAG